MHSFFQHLIQFCIFLQIIFVCSSFLRRDIEHDGCQYSYSTFYEKPSEDCEYERYSVYPIDLIMFVIGQWKLPILEYGFLGRYMTFSPWLLLALSIYLFHLAAFSEAEKAQSSSSYIVKRFIRLIIAILIPPILFLLLPKMTPKLFDHGRMLHYLFLNRYLDKNFFQVPLVLFIHELILFAIFFHSMKIVNIGRRLIQWSLKHPMAVIVEFVILTMMNNFLMNCVNKHWDQPTLSFLHYALLLYIFQKNPHLRSNVAKHAGCLLLGIVCLIFLFDNQKARFMPAFIYGSTNFDTLISVSIFYLSTLFLFSLFLNLIELKYDVRTPKDDDLKKPLLVENI